MHIFKKILRFLVYTALIAFILGLAGFFEYYMPWLQDLAMYVFLLLIFIDIMLSVISRNMLQELYMAFQGIFIQLPALIYLYIKHGFKLPSIRTYKQGNEYSLPFEGEWLVIAGGISKESSHSWLMGSQRYAYDFVIVDEHGHSFKDSEESMVDGDYYCYNQNILAPADGTIVEIRNSDSNIIGEGDWIKDLRGNYIVIKHMGNEYSLLAHLKRDSILVNLGQKVKCGDIIAKCGNTGSSSEPHLHFQLQRGKSFFSSPGLPIKFSNFSAKLFKLYNKTTGLKVYPDELYDGFITRGFLVKNNSLK